MKRCSWASGSDTLMQAYHDHEYGRRKTNDRALFEKLCLECFQAGLSWRTVLHKREALRAAFYGFDPEKTAAITPGYTESLMQNRAIIRNRRKIEATVHNARLFTQQFAKQGCFTNYVYGFTDGDALCRDLKKRGFRFMGPTICVSFLQSVGAVEGHEPECDLYGQDRV